VAISIENLHHSYGRNKEPAVDNLSLDIKKGQLYVLLGPSGCGKTTTMRCIAGLETPQEGRIAVDGRPVLDVGRRINVPTHKRNIGMVFQSYAIWPHKTVFENVAFPLRMQGIKSKSAAGRVSAILEKVGLGGYEDRGASMLSGGQMQRVALARSIAMQPRVLLFDEPLSNLDARLRENLRFEIRALQQEFGFTAVYVTHDQSEALALGDEIAVMKAGRIVQQGTPIELYRNPVSGFVAAFLGVGNIFPAQVIAREAGGTRVRIDGTSLELVSSSVAEVGERVIATFRDEDVKVTARGAEGVAEANSLTGTVRVGSFLGSEVRYQCVVGDDLTVKSSMSAIGSPFPNGDAVTIRIARDAVRLVDADESAAISGIDTFAADARVMSG
jgi:iron(III) transport system ATP-binding protein